MKTKYILYMTVKHKDSDVKQTREYTFKNKRCMNEFVKIKYEKLKAKMELKYPNIVMSYEIVPQLINITFNFEDLK